MKRKNITIIGINYYPEDSATGLYTTQLAEYLVEKGNSVNVLTGFPYYPEWKIREEYEDRPKFYGEKANNVQVYRYKQYIPRSPTILKRMLHLLDFLIGTLFNSFRVKKVDLVFVVVPFTGSILVGILMKILKKAKLWVHIQDFEVDVFFESGILGGGGMFKKLLGKVARVVESWLYNRADVVSTISNAMMAELEKRTACRTYFLPNWADTDFMDPGKAQGHSYFKKNKFNVLYSGNIGEKQDWDFFIDLAEKSKDNKKVRFNVVGDGAKKKWLLKKVKQMPNVRHFKPVPYSELPDLLCKADLHVLFQKHIERDMFMPSKILGMMSSGVPSLVTGNVQSEVARVFKESQGGLFRKAKDLAACERVIKDIQKGSKKYASIGQLGREYVEKMYSYESVLGKFAGFLDVVLK